ncbi:hypothetical protein MKW98_011715 [Papaver atlanticum]|uniref:Uncharacterized protein n=1 Tax=Papaver atlanticum TaxID=357466 RepID=A0AAD4S8E6_9MAGN|nr:hypothetical protein MKW98_011715 [Papaver atlanticum]
MLPGGKTYGPLKQMCVFLIKPLAFQERCVDHCSNTCLTDSGSLSKTDDDEYYVAVVAQGIKPCFEILPGVVKNIDYDNKLFQISR